MTPSRGEVLRELQRIAREGWLSPQERELLRLIVVATLDNQTAKLYQKALAADLGLLHHEQIGVLASRIRTKLADHYRQSHASPVQIALSKRGYEAIFTYRLQAAARGDRVDLLIANAKSAIDQRTLPGAGLALDYLDQAIALEPGHPLLLPLKAYCYATRALFGTLSRQDLERAAAIVAQTRDAPDRPWESWFAQACVEMALHWDWQGARSSFDRAIALSEGLARFQPWYRVSRLSGPSRPSRRAAAHLGQPPVR